MNGRFPFNVRVYGLLQDGNKVLVSDEKVHGRSITKFPGGGLEYGEGPAECIIREWKEELGQQIEVLSHFYTTDFFQRSAFRDEDQVISIYYKVALLSNDDTRSIRSNSGNETFRWMDMDTVEASHFTFPIDQRVFEMLKKAKR